MEVNPPAAESRAQLSQLRRTAARFLPCILLIAGFWVVRYFHFMQFGLYEDDLTHLPTVFEMSFGQIIRYAADPGRIAGLREQGHPLHNSFIYLLSGLGWRLNGLQGTYLVGFAVQSLNIFLFYSLLHRIHGQSLAILGGLAYVFYSADTTQAFLTYSLGIHPSLTFLLLALHAHVSGRYTLAHIVAALTLLTYESTYMLFLTAPLLRSDAGAVRRRRLWSQALIMLSVLAGYILWRIRAGDDRILGLEGWEHLTQPGLNALVGPVVSFGTYLIRPYQAAASGNKEAWIAAGLVFAGIFLLLSRMQLAVPRMPSRVDEVDAPLAGGTSISQRARKAWANTPEEARALARIALAGVIMLVLAYPIMLTVRPNALSGRDTRVHAAGVVGASILIGSLLLLILWVAQGKQRRRIVALVISAWLGLLAGYGFVIQNDYVLAWEYQKQFWRELLPLISDVGEGDAVLVDPGALRDTRQIGANYWNMPVVLEQLYVFPEEWARPPRVYRLSEDWRSNIMWSADTVALNGASTYASPSAYYLLHMKDAVLIVARDDRLTRLVGPTLLDREEEWAGHPDPTSGLPYPTRTLFDLMLGETSEG